MKSYSLTIETATAVLAMMRDKAKKLAEIEALEMAISVMQDTAIKVYGNKFDGVVDGLSIEQFNEQLKSGKVEAVQVSYDYYKGFYDGINSVLNRKDK